VQRRWLVHLVPNCGCAIGARRWASILGVHCLFQHSTRQPQPNVDSPQLGIRNSQLCMSFSLEHTWLSRGHACLLGAEVLHCGACWGLDLCNNGLRCYQLGRAAAKHNGPSGTAGRWPGSSHERALVWMGLHHVCVRGLPAV